LSIYVETRIRGSLEELWHRTQTPKLHARWDLRLGPIVCLKGADDSQPRRFRFATRAVIAAKIEGCCETVGESLDANTRTEAFEFGSDDPHSLIRTGSGYWKYVQIEDEVRFITSYDYEVRWGLFGRLIEWLLIRPLLGWATAWSFDRLRLWIENGLDPQHAARQSLIHALAAATIAFIWLWQGFVPKLLALHPDELAMLLAGGVPEQLAPAVLRLLGAAEMAFGAIFLLCARRRWAWLVTIALMAATLIGVLARAPEQIVAPFSPVAFNLLLAVLAGIGLLSLRDLPSARRCLRRPPTEFEVNNSL
jgi:hypothetical protein